ncbi:hypothetical protein [Natronococcus sp.]|uniref:hypothetical protein n=1 Tax=Natronococcus sp. TaxID=35747 RepID=UPI0025D5B8FD|nr:hypothetical protein [Natronococcus sp.]
MTAAVVPLAPDSETELASRAVSDGTRSMVVLSANPVRDANVGVEDASILSFQEGHKVNLMFIV